MSDDFFLRNRSTIAIITGATQGLGLAIAGRLAREGAPGMVISGRNTEKGEWAAEKLHSLGTDCVFVKADVGISKRSSSFSRAPQGFRRLHRRLIPKDGCLLSWRTTRIRTESPTMRNRKW
jgi:NAD(P)-dependent dehydrogenase (short-subunit alcohol dehydrogenase family)